MGNVRIYPNPASHKPAPFSLLSCNRDTGDHIAAPFHLRHRRRLLSGIPAISDITSPPSAFRHRRHLRHPTVSPSLTFSPQTRLHQNNRKSLPRSSLPADLNSSDRRFLSPPYVAAAADLSNAILAVRRPHSTGLSPSLLLYSDLKGKIVIFIIQHDN
ncbi:hypothetical protein L2E82_03759 [Cichorium intybus]|uniref:Uncharacterized protein n=1 Tax=Cichorium intybus TaxID=13427 RepID=A0ACB9H424_CICIN|nr:hypothetical protein L2E82_03759 [Cichorium intybus]